MEPTQQIPQIQQPPRHMDYEDPSRHPGREMCVLGREVPVRWPRPACTAVLVQRLT